MVDTIELNLPMSDRTDPQLSFNTRSPGMAIDGSEQIISPLSERWTFSAVFPILDATAARTIRIVKSRLKGRFNYLLLRICDQYRITRKDVGFSVGDDGPGTPHSDGAYFSDGTGYQTSPQPSAPIMAVAAANATQVIVSAAPFNGKMSAGVFFDINYYLYQIDGWELSSDGLTYTLDISPPLRAAVSTADMANFDAKCLWRLETDSEGRLDLQIGKFGFVTLNLVEPIGR